MQSSFCIFQWFSLHSSIKKFISGLWHKHFSRFWFEWLELAAKSIVNSHAHLSVYCLGFTFSQDHFQTDPGQSEQVLGPSSAPAGLMLETGSGRRGTATPFLLGVSPVCQHHHHIGASPAARTWGWKTEVWCLAGCTTSSCGETREENRLCLGAGPGCEGVVLLQLLVNMCDFTSGKTKKKTQNFLTPFLKKQSKNKKQIAKHYLIQ